MVDIFLKIFPDNFSIFADHQPCDLITVSEQKKKIELAPGDYLLTITADGFHSMNTFLQARGSRMVVEEKLEKTDSTLMQFAELQTGRQPKSVVFSPDGRYLFTALLDGGGVEVYSSSNFEKVKNIIFPEPYGSRRGFVEFEFLPDHDELWVSQMTTGLVHSIDLKTLDYSYSIPTRGLWPKVISVDEGEKKAYVSNWVSKDISIIDIDSKKTTALISVGGTPRGMAFSRDQKYLYVCLYDTGDIDKIDLEQETVVDTIHSDGGSKRHIVLDRKKNLFYVSDMYWGSVYILSGDTDRFIRKITIDYNPNTISLTSGGKYLFISSRGPNHPETYLRKGPRFGRIYVLDTENLLVKEWIWGKNQPTGLALSPDDRFLAYSNFLDASIEIYWTGLGY